MVQARVIVSFDKSNKVVHAKRSQITNKVFALSHRWQDRPGSDQWTVECDGESYPCELFDEEVMHLDSYARKYGNLWLDYICIKQGDEDDKIAQVSIMGNIYSNATSLIVGVDLAPCMPKPEYIDRAWCIQERMFGRVRFPWDLDNEDPAQLVEFARDLLTRMGPLDPISDKLWDDYDYREDWRVTNLNKAKNSYPNLSSEIDQAIQLMTSSEKTELAKLVLRMREKISCDDPVDEKWNEKMFDCVCSFAHDRLYGVWGVPMYHKGVELPYDNPQGAWNLVAQHYPNAGFGFYSRLISKKGQSGVDQPFFGFTEHTNVEDLVCNLLQCGNPGSYDPDHVEHWEYNMRPERCDPAEVLKVKIRRSPGFLSIVWEGDESIGVVIDISAMKARKECKHERPFTRLSDRVIASSGRGMYWRCQFELHNYVAAKIQSGQWR